MTRYYAEVAVVYKFEFGDEDIEDDDTPTDAAFELWNVAHTIPSVVDVDVRTLRDAAS